MADEPQSQLSGLLSPTLIALIGGLVMYFTSEPRLRSLRPDLSTSENVPAPPSPKGLYALHSRLWDDPLTVAHQDSQRRQREKDADVVSRVRTAFRNNEEHEEEPDVSEYFRQLAVQFQKAHVCTNKADAALVCLPVLIPGEPYEDDTEQRKRMTYAVLASLSRCGYELVSPDRLTYIEVPVLVQPISRLKYTFTTEHFVVPLKVFQRNTVPTEEPTGPEGVLVLWINEDQLGKQPLASIGQILETLFGHYGQKDKKDEKEIGLRILGPADSDTLLDMAEEDQQRVQYAFLQYLIKMASAPEHKIPAVVAAIMRGWSRSPDPSSASDDVRRNYLNARKPYYFSRFSNPKLINGRSTAWAPALVPSARTQLTWFHGTGSGLDVVHAIGTDADLVRLIIQELHRRGVLPEPKSDNKHCQKSSKKCIVLVTERDTLYGSAFPTTFRMIAQNCSREDASSDPEIRVFKFLRGIDGKLPTESVGKDAEPNSDKKQGRPEGVELDPQSSADLESIPPSGRSQFDYLRRLERRLIELDREQKKEGGGISAIGVVGTDVYDKLLVLRALRRKFPSVWFFSTDLHAELSLPSEYPTARNLLVASHFGLEMHNDLNQDAPPFRDSYQTAVYFSGLLALGHPVIRNWTQNPESPWGPRMDTSCESERCGCAAPLDPLMFEIGRNGPYQLRACHEHWLRRHKRLLLPLLLSCILTVFVYQPARRVVKFICVGDKLTPRVWTFRIGLVGLMLFVAWCVMLCFAVWDHEQPNGEPFVVAEGVSIWPSTLIRMTMAVISIGFLLRMIAHMHKALESAKQIGNPRAMAAPSSRRDWLEAIAPDWDRPNSTSGLVKRYKILGPIAYLWCAIACTSLVVILAIVYLLLDDSSVSPPFPYRGNCSLRCAWIALGAAVFGLLCLFFFVLIAFQRCRALVERVAAVTPDWNVFAEDKRLQRRARDYFGDDRELLTIDLIATVTHHVGAQLKFPLIILFLMMLSRLSVFDKLDLYWSIVLFWATIAGCLIYAAWQLRNAASKARGDILDRLRAALSFSVAAKLKTRERQVRIYIAKIEKEDRGAFQPWTSDPLIYAITWAGTSGAFLIQHLWSY